MPCIGIGQMYNVYQHWDPLRVCIVGRSYSPKFYDYIKDHKVKQVFYKIAEETEEDYQTLIAKLESFGITVLRPEVSDNYKDCIGKDGKIMMPPMTPRDYTAMFGSKFFISDRYKKTTLWNDLAGANWPDCPPSKEEFDALPLNILNEIATFGKIYKDFEKYNPYEKIIKEIEKQGNPVYNNPVANTATITRIGKDLYFGKKTLDVSGLVESVVNYDSILPLLPEFRHQYIDSVGHTDGIFCPVHPGLIVSIMDSPIYQDSFPGWEVIYLPGQSWSAVSEFLKLKEKNAGKWWVPGQELNDDFTSYVETWMNHWVGYVEETVFDVNMLVVDQKNVICNNYNKTVFDAFDRYGITGHVVNFRHRYFWDGGLHCITSDLDRQGSMQDFFPNRS